MYGTQGATVHRSITLVSEATDHRNLYVGATRGRDVNELYVLADMMEDARHTLETALARDRVDTPAVAVRRELLGQTSGVGVGITTQEDWTTTTRTPRGGEGSPRPVAGRIPEEPALDPSDPFAGLETVHHTLQRLLAEQAARQAPRHGYRVLEGDLARLQGERERLEHGPRPYEHGPLDRVHTVRHNAGVEVSQLTSRLEHAPWRDRRRIRRLLADATQRLEQAEAAYQTAYQREIGRLEPLIEAARVRLEHAPRPEPIGPREQELERGIGWLHWEDGVGNGERPTLEALHERRDQLDQAATRQRPLTPGEQAVYRAIVGELDDRGMQYQTAVEAQQQSVLARQQALRTAHPGGYRGLGCQL